MGRREPIAVPSATGPAAASLAKQEFAAIELQVGSLMQEARMLREEAQALREAPHRPGDALQRCGLLHRQSLLCSTEAMELMRFACLRPENHRQ